MLRWENESRNFIKGYQNKQADGAWNIYQKRQAYRNHI